MHEYALLPFILSLGFIAGCPGTPQQGDAGPDPLISACASSLTCNPITNTGCTSQPCFVDHDLVTSPAASCYPTPVAPTVVAAVGGRCGSAAIGGVVCGAGLTCQNGKCHRVCCMQDPHACADLARGSTCIVAQAESGIGTCDVACDWGHQIGCSAGETCTAGQNGAAFCVPGGSLVEYAVCPGTAVNRSYDCYPGTECTLASLTSGQHRCIRIGSATSCPAGHTFVPGTAAGNPAGFGFCFLACTGPSSPCPQGSQCGNITFAGTTYTICYAQ